MLLCGIECSQLRLDAVQIVHFKMQGSLLLVHLLLKYVWRKCVDFTYIILDVFFMMKPSSPHFNSSTDSMHTYVCLCIPSSSRGTQQHRHPIRLALNAGQIDLVFWAIMRSVQNDVRLRACFWKWGWKGHQVQTHCYQPQIQNKIRKNITGKQKVNPKRSPKLVTNQVTQHAILNSPGETNISISEFVYS